MVTVTQAAVWLNVHGKFHKVYRLTPILFNLAAADKIANSSATDRAAKIARARMHLAPG